MKRIISVLVALMAIGASLNAQKLYMKYNEFEKDTLVSYYFKSLNGGGVGYGAVQLLKGIMLLDFCPSSDKILLYDGATLTFLDDKGETYEFKIISGDYTRGHLFYGNIKELMGKNLVKFRITDKIRGSVQRDIKKKLSTAISDCILALINKAKELNMVIKEYEPLE